MYKKKEKYIKYVNINLLKQKEKTNSICIDIIKVDELWSFVKNKKNQRWLWYAINHDTGEIVAYTFGKRKDTVFLKLKKLLGGKPKQLREILVLWLKPQQVVL